MNYLVSVEEIQQLIGINLSHADDVYFRQYISRAQIEDLRPLLGDRLFADINKNPEATTNGSYPNLLNEFEYVDGSYEYISYGLKTVIAYFAVAHYRFDGQEIDTPYGFAEVEAGNLQKSSRERNREMSQYYKNLGFSYWDTVRDYLQRKTDEYKLWYGDQPAEWDNSNKRNTVQSVSLW